MIGAVRVEGGWDMVAADADMRAGGGRVVRGVRCPLPSLSACPARFHCGDDGDARGLPGGRP